MMSKFNPLKVKDIRRETTESVSVAFDVPPALQIAYQYKQGQYITLKMIINGEELRRSYSLCTSPHCENELRVAIKEVPGGRVSSYINKNLKVGDTIEVMTPMGTFHSSLNGGAKKDYVLFAGGSGITPMMSILKSVLYIEKQSTVHLFYANKNEECTIFKKQIDEIAESNSQLKVHYIFDQPSAKISELQTGIISPQKAKELLVSFGAANADEYFVCGPGPMMENVKQTLEELKIAKEKIHIEYFTAVIEATKVDSSAEVNAKITVIQYGIETEIDLKTNGMSILDAAIEAGVDAPFSCKGAVCCTCRAKILEGEVKMDANFALTDDEVAQGFVLTCQSHPLTEKVVVDFDAI
jgi:ring-1,2-phenylacetyl-CoA epoxidase subunit PaaE